MHRELGKRGFGLLATFALTTLGMVLTPAPVNAQDGDEAPSGDTTTVEVSFGGICEPVGTPDRPQPGAGYATITLPTAVEQGETFTVEVEDVSGPPANSDPSLFTGRFEVAGVSGGAFSSSNLSGEFSDIEMTATGEPGSEVVIKLTEVSVRWLPPPGAPPGAYGQDCASEEVPPDSPLPPEVTASIPIEAPTCFGVTASVVGLPDQVTVEGTPGSDVIVAWAPEATIAPGGGHDFICARSGDGTLSYVDADRGVILWLAQGIGVGGSGLMRFEGIANVDGSPGADVLVGDGGDNTLVGGAGRDVLFGLGGADVLDGGSGRNVLVGDEADTCTNGRAIGC